MPGTSRTIERVLTLLAETPTRIAALTADLSPEAFRGGPPEKSGPPARCSRICERVLTSGASASGRSSKRTGQRGGRLVPAPGSSRQTILTWNSGPRLAPLPRSVPDLLAVLSPLPIDAWSRVARVSTVGRALEPTVLSYTERLVVHERSHLRQIAGIVLTMLG
jgi:hypothetical protein